MKVNHYRVKVAFQNFDCQFLPGDEIIASFSDSGPGLAPRVLVGSCGAVVAEVHPQVINNLVDEGKIKFLKQVNLSAQAA